MLQAVTSPPQFDVSKIERSGLTRNEKFREMDRIFKEMSSSCSEVGHREFCARYEFIASVQSAWQAGKCVFLLA